MMAIDEGLDEASSHPENPMEPECLEPDQDTFSPWSDSL